MATRKTTALTIQTFVGKVMSLLFNTLSRFVITILPRSKRHLILQLQSLDTLILEPKKMKPDTISILSPSIHHGMIRLDVMISVFWMLSFKPPFSLSFTFIKRLFRSSLLSAIKVVSSTYLSFLIFLPAILIPVCYYPACFTYKQYIYNSLLGWKVNSLTFSFSEFSLNWYAYKE